MANSPGRDVWLDLGGSSGAVLHNCRIASWQFEQHITPCPWFSRNRGALRCEPMRTFRATVVYEATGDGTGEAAPPSRRLAGDLSILELLTLVEEKLKERV